MFFRGCKKALAFRAIWSAATIGVALLVVALPSHAIARASFHPAQSMPERALDHILRTVFVDARRPNNLYRPMDFKKEPGFDFRTVLTPALLASIWNAQKAAVQANCGGDEHRAEICGLEYNPLVCGQDLPPGYLYRSDPLAGGRVRIFHKLKYADPDKFAMAYFMAQSGGTWKLDGIGCDLGSFNAR